MYYYVNICPLRVPLYGNKRYSVLFYSIWVRNVVLKANFNNMSVISWRSVLLVNGKTPTCLKSHRVHVAMSGIRTHHILGVIYFL